jgi:hypothetical protein
MGDTNLQHQRVLVSVLQLCGLTPEGASNIGMTLCAGQSGPGACLPGILSNNQQDQLLGQLAAEAAKGGKGGLPPELGKVLAVALSVAANTELKQVGLKDSWFIRGLVRIIEALGGELVSSGRRPA